VAAAVAKFPVDCEFRMTGLGLRNGMAKSTIEMMRPVEIGHHAVFDHDIFAGSQNRCKKLKDGERR
jgi:hypothetical protein